MVLAGTANAGEAGQAEAGQGQPAPGRGDTVPASINSNLTEMLNQQIGTATRHGRMRKRKAAMARRRGRLTSSSTRSCRNSARSATSCGQLHEPEESAQAASDREFRRYMMMGGGARASESGRRR